MIASHHLKAYRSACICPLYSVTFMSLLQLRPPMRNGVSASRILLPQSKAYCSIFEFLCAQFQHISPQEWQQRFSDQLILDQNLNYIDINTPYQANQSIFYYRFLAHEVHVPHQHHIIFENNDIIVVDKPHFLTTSPSGRYLQETLLVRLKHQTQNEDLSPIHRLDRETAGLIMFSKRPESRAIYQQLFANRQITKYYHAIADYNPALIMPQTVICHLKKSQPFYTMCIDHHLAANSETEIDILKHTEKYAKYLLKPKTGKQHQLRVHLNHLGIPIHHDSFYPCIAHKREDDFSKPLQLLAYMLAFIDPMTRQKMQFFSHQELTLP